VEYIEKQLTSLRAWKLSVYDILRIALPIKCILGKLNWKFAALRSEAFVQLVAPLERLGPQQVRHLLDPIAQVS
jgi:hypothetical protein